ncbi:TPA: ead/Ea22-like family protein [Klebsiella pneumoniae]|nr:ead/Ea22-like family protein [Klebsiella pneumoniae]
MTELAKRMKAAAEKATQGEWRRASTQFNGITATPFMLGRKEVIIAGASEKRDAEFIALANPANIIALVEALEKAQGMEAYWKTQCRGITDHCEELQARIAELESRSVKLPAERFCPAEYAGSQLWSETEVWNKAITACADALRADGIKVEAE